jgi:phosphoheptose isomerase
MKKNTGKILRQLIMLHPELAPITPDITEAFGLLARSYREGHTILVCGNGGSAADSEHMVGELMKGYVLKRSIPRRDVKKIRAACPGAATVLCRKLQRAFPAISLVSQVSLSTAIANDVGAEMVFAQQVYGYGKRGDALVAISTSGNAANVLNAVYAAKAFGIHTIGLTGAGGGKLKGRCDVAICVPATLTWRIQELHQPVYHALCAMLESEFFGT